MKLGKQTIVFLAVNKNGDEEYFSVEDHNSAIVLPKGSIYKLTNKYLTWEDDPISLKSVIEIDSL